MNRLVNHPHEALWGPIQKIQLNHAWISDPNKLWDNKLVNCDGVNRAAERSYPTFEVRGRSREDPMPEGRWPRGVTPRQRSGAAAESARLQQCMNGREELPYIGSQGRQPGGATPPPRSGGCMGTGGPRGATPHSRSGGAAVRKYPSSKVRETQVRRQALQEGIREQTHWNRNHKELVNLITLGPQPCLTQWN